MSAWLLILVEYKRTALRSRVVGAWWALLIILFAKPIVRTVVDWRLVTRFTRLAVASVLAALFAYYLRGF